MPNSTSTTNGAIDRFWDRFIENFQKQGIKEQHWRWYVIHAERYCQAFPAKRLAGHRADEVNAYLKNLG
jgi:hypothetical protein